MNRALVLFAALFATLAFAGGTGTPCLYPANSQFFKLEYGTDKERMFERNLLERNKLAGEGGWQGEIDGKEVSIWPGGKPEAKQRFSCGLPIRGGEEPARTDGAVDRLFPSKEDVEKQIEEARKVDIWGRSGRFRFISANPNTTATVLGGLALAMFWVALMARRWWTKAAGLCIFGVLAVLMAKTESRGAGVALLAAFAAMAAFKLKEKFSRKAIFASIATAVCAALAIGWFCGGRFAIGKGDDLRRDILRCVPAMLADSPEGVGLGNSGAAYLVWYRDIDKTRTVRTLISSHLTWLVEFGRTGRVLYAAGWLAVLGICGVFAFRGGSPLPLGLWIFLGVAGLFNPVLETWQTWVLPAAALAAPVFSRRRPSWKAAGIVCAASMAVSCGALAAVTALGSAREDAVPLRISKGVVKVGKGEPSIWIASDEFATGGWTFAGVETMSYFEEFPDAKAIALVEKLDALPAKAEKLVLTGRLAAEYAERWRGAGRESLCKADAILLVSPSIPATEFPADAAARMRAAVGALAARLDKGYETPPPKWVRLVPGALLYIPGWVRLAEDF